MSKIGAPQFQSGIVQDLSRLMAKKPIAAKLIGNAVNLGIARTIKAQSPGTLIVIRAAMDNWSLDAGVVDFCNRSMRVAQPFLDEGLCDLLEPPNEPPQLTPELARILNTQMVQCASIYKTNGFQPIAYSFSVGQPNYEFWPLLSDGVVASDGWTGLHEYGVMPLSWDAQDLCLRHRKVFPLLSSAAQRVFKVGITECFLDFGIGRPPDGYPTSGGYRKMPQVGDDEDYWIRTLTQQLDWWDAQLALDPYVIFATGFGYAMQPPWDEDNLKFDVADVDTDRAYYIAWQKSGSVVPPPISVSHSASSSASASPSHEPESDMQVYEPYAFPKRLSEVAWTGNEGTPTGGQPFYRIQPSAGLLVGVSAFAQIAITDVHGTPLAGVKVVNDFGDGTGELQQTDAKGVVQFNFGTSSAFTPPNPPPLTFYVVDDSATRDEDRPHILRYRFRLSDIVHGGDTNGTHTQGAFVLVQQVVMPDAVSRDDAIRLRAYPAKALSVPVFCAECALQAQGRKRELKAVLSDEFYVTWAGAQYVCQGFAMSILATRVGHYADSDFFEVDW